MSLDEYYNRFYNLIGWLRRNIICFLNFFDKTTNSEILKISNKKYYDAIFNQSNSNEPQNDFASGFNVLNYFPSKKYDGVLPGLCSAWTVVSQNYFINFL